MKAAIECVQIFGGYGYVKDIRRNATCVTRKSVRFTKAPTRFNAGGSKEAAESEMIIIRR